MQKKEKSKKKRRRNLMPKIILAVFVVYASVTLVQNQVEANRSASEVEKTEMSISGEKLKKIELEEKYADLEQLFRKESSDEYMEYMKKKAEEQGFVDSNAIIFEDVSKN